MTAPDWEARALKAEAERDALAERVARMHKRLMEIDVDIGKLLSGQPSGMDLAIAIMEWQKTIGRPPGTGERRRDVKKKQPKVTPGFTVICDICEETLQAQGGLFFATPDGGLCRKWHLCLICVREFLGWAYWRKAKIFVDAARRKVKGR